MTRQLGNIVELQRALDELGAAERLLAGIPDWMQELHEEHSKQTAQIESLEADVESAAQERRAAEAAINDLREKVKHFQEQIGLVRNQREYGALLQEIDGAKRQISELEEHALAAMERQDEASQRLRDEREAFQELDQRHAIELEKWEAQKPDVAKQAAELRSRIALLKERIPRGLVASFERTFERYSGRALARVLEVDRGSKMPTIWHCGACNYRVRPQVVVAIQTRGDIETCDSCKRILYIDEGP